MRDYSARSIGLTAVLALALSACGTGGDDASGDAGSDTISIVASTNVYGSIAEAIAGDDATVTSIITSSTQDPHEYEATAQNRLAIDRADIVIENGGGFDPFVDTMLDASDAKPVVLTAVDISGLLPAEDEHEHEHEGEGEEHDHGDEHEGHDHIEGFNEHVWYSLPTADKVAKQLSEQLAKLDPQNADTFEANYAAFAKELDGLETSAADVKSSAKGANVAITEPVPLYLLDEVGLVNVTPEEFSEAVEEGTDVPARVLKETLDLVSGGDVAMLAYNEQAEDSTTEQVREAADKAKVPVVDFTETLPEGKDYVTWMRDNVDNIAAVFG